MTEMMKAVAVVDERKAEIVEIERPEPDGYEILVKVHACALCTFEQRVFIRENNKPLPFVGGHEVSGEIYKIGKYVDPELYPIGRKVAVRTQPSCGSCYYCRRGQSTQCLDYKRIGKDLGAKKLAGLAEYICVDKSRVWMYDDSFDYTEIALTEPVSCVLNSISRTSHVMGDDAVVIGGGVMGQLHIKLLKKLGLRVILSEPNEERRKFALQNGCDIVIDPTKEDAVEKVKSLTDGRGAENVFNTTAIFKLEEDAIKMTAPRGTCVTYSSQHPDHPVEVSPGWLHSTESIITGAVNPSIESYDRAVNVINKRIITVKDLVSKVYPKEQATEAFNDALSPATYRVVITF